MDKTERLINLTMALLSSRRFLAKSEIYSIVPGYSGSAQTKERMFERDKNDLRDLGLEIEVGNDDPLFDDEPGYRIDANQYSFDLGELDGTDLALLSLAAAQWRNSLLSKSGQSALRKLEALSPACDTEILQLPLQMTEVPEGHFEILWTAITKRLRVAFTYSSIHESFRTVAPYGLTLVNGFWYLVGEDLTKEQVRRFKLVRMSSDLTVINQKSFFERPDPQTMAGLLQFGNTAEQSIDVQLLLAKGRAYEIRALATVTNSSDDWESATLTVDSQYELFSLLARAGTSAIITQPINVRNAFVEWMRGKKIG